MTVIALRAGRVAGAVVLAALATSALVACAGTSQPTHVDGASSASASSAVPPSPVTATTSTTSVAPGSPSTAAPGGSGPAGGSAPPTSGHRVLDAMPTWEGPKRSLPMSTAEISTGRPSAPTTRPAGITADAWCTVLRTPDGGRTPQVQGELCATGDPRRVAP